MWYTNAIGEEKINTIFGGEFPLVGVELENIIFRAPTILQAQFLCKNLPCVIPEKWRKDEINAISLAFSMSDIFSLTVEGGAIGFICSPDVSIYPQKAVLSISGDGFKLHCEAKSLTIDGFTPYFDERWD